MKPPVIPKPRLSGIWRGWKHSCWILFGCAGFPSEIPRIVDIDGSVLKANDKIGGARERPMRGVVWRRLGWREARNPTLLEEARRFGGLQIRAQRLNSGP